MIRWTNGTFDDLKIYWFKNAFIFSDASDSQREL